MIHTLFARIGLIVAALVVFTSPALAGGWALVTLDALPEEPRAGATLTLGFMVLQHGETPNGNVDATLLATNTETGATVRATARKEGPEGHFVVDVTFPAAGTWEWEIAPAPFPATKLGRLTVLPAAAATGSGAAPATVDAARPAIEPSTLRWAGAALLLVAVALGLLGRRRLPQRPGALQPR